MALDHRPAPSVRALQETEKSQQQKSRTSETICMVPLVGCLKVAEQELGPDRSWKTVNDMQSRFLGWFLETSREGITNLPELESIASYHPDAVNGFLRAHRFNIQLPEYGRPDIGMASVLKVLIEWQTRGIITTVRDGQYPAAHVRGDMTFYRSPWAPEPIVALPTKSGDVVCMMACKNPPTGFDLLVLLSHLKGARHAVNDYKEVVFPMITYDSEVDISWIQGLHTVGNDGQLAKISRAFQQTKFRMNDVGAKIETAAAMVATRSAGPTKLVIDQPFLLWIYRPNVLTQPYFVGYFTEEVWQDPGTLG